MSAPSRRAVLAGGGVAVVGALAVAWTLRPEPAPAPERAVVPSPGPRGGADVEGVRAEALASAGLRLAESPWRHHVPGHTGPWSAVFASWLLRRVGVTAEADPAALYAAFATAGRTGTRPQAGALVFYTFDAPGSVHHVGFVEGVRGVAVGTVEGDVPGQADPAHTFVRRFGRPWDARVVYGYPDYAAGVTSSS